MEFICFAGKKNAGIIRTGFAVKHIFFQDSALFYIKLITEEKTISAKKQVKT